jgi:hypothetical protein
MEWLSGLPSVYVCKYRQSGNVECRIAEMKFDIKVVVNELQTNSEGGRWKQLPHVLCNGVI